MVIIEVPRRAERVTSKPEVNGGQLIACPATWHTAGTSFTLRILCVSDLLADGMSVAQSHRFGDWVRQFPLAHYPGETAIGAHSRYQSQTEGSAK
jgi:hypothetical protein